MAVCRVEVVASTVEDVRAAAAGGADRVEFCSHLNSGGLTPGRSLIEAALAVAREKGLGFRLLIRPREGDFVYSEAERGVIVREAEAGLSLGADKVVTGGLDGRGDLDFALLESLNRAIGLGHVVFHRAFDEVAQPHAVAEQLQEAGIGGLLTSGGQVKAIDGILGIAHCVGRGLSVVAGAGVVPEHAERLVDTGVEAVHASCRIPVPSVTGRLFDFGRTKVDAEKVKALVEAVRAVARP